MPSRTINVGSQVRERMGSAPATSVAQPQGAGQNVSESNAENYNVFYSKLSSDEGNWVEAGNYDYCSDRASRGIGGLTRTDTGFGPIAAGTGIQTSVLPGQPTIMADGQILLGPDGAG